VKEIVRRTVEAYSSSFPGSALSAADFDALTAHVIGRLERSDKGNDDAASASAPSSSSLPTAAAAASADSPRSRSLRKATETTRPPSMFSELVQQRSKLRKAADSVASKYQKPSKSSAGGSGGVFSSMQESSLLNSLQDNLDKRRKDIAGDDDTVDNTSKWSVDDTTTL